MSITENYRDCTIDWFRKIHMIFIWYSYVSSVMILKNCQIDYTIQFTLYSIQLQYILYLCESSYLHDKRYRTWVDIRFLGGEWGEGGWLFTRWKFFSIANRIKAYWQFIPCYAMARINYLITDMLNEFNYV